MSTYILYLKSFYILLYAYQYFGHMYVCASRDLKTAWITPRFEAADCCELSCRSWKLNPSLLQEHLLLSFVEYLSSLKDYAFCYYM